MASSLNAAALVSISQGDNSVRAGIRGADGREETISVPYLVACDGAHSAVRHALGLSFDGQDYEAIVFLADVKLNTAFNRSRIANFTSPRGFVSILPFLGDFARIFAVDFAKQNRPPTDPLTLPDLQDTVDAVVPFSVALRDPRWITRFRSPSRQVASNRRNRVFLAGDAAHAHSPAGGQGMNTGLQDAFNLGWKLAMVLRGQAPDTLLDSFDAERHPVATMAQRETDLMFRSFLVRNRVIKTMRDLALRTLVPLKPVRRKLAQDLSGIGIGYSFTKQSSAARRRENRRGLRAGDRVPDLELWSTSRPIVRLYELLRRGTYAFITYASLGRLGTDREKLREVLARVSDDNNGAVTPWVVLDEGLPQEAGVCAPVLVDFKGEFSRRLGAGHGSALLIRPDGYLAFHVRRFDPNEIITSIEAWVSSNASMRGQNKPRS
ncbi:hypothetical protein X748_24260 [Mesorhizobium sp. LNJC386A00]|nr:hypothetical protein X752_21240 [Mesorhizobium sp. LNJC398B00]ESY32083.1 hypothetical protein X748_24260 [Mesorhizobium sp. LNJC386A00]